MTETTATDSPPTDRNQALAWLIARHPYLKDLLRQINGHDPVDAALDLPPAFSGQGENADLLARVIAPMSGGQQRVLRAIAFLTGRVPIGVEDLYGVSLPGSQAEFFDDWLALVATGIDNW